MSSESRKGGSGKRLASLFFGANVQSFLRPKRKTLKDPPIQEKPCLVCSKAKRHNNVYCSVACRDEHKKG